MLKKKYTKIFLILGLSLFLKGCMTLGTVEIEIIKPAKIALPGEIRSLLVLNNSLLFHLDSFANAYQKGLYSLDTATTQILVAQVNGILNESPRFDTSILIQDIYFRRATDILQPLDWQSVNKICNENNADALVSLEAFGIIDTVIRVIDYDGFAYLTYKNLELFVNSLWRIYLVKDQKILERRVYRDTIIVSELSSKKEYLEAVTDPEGIDYFAEKIASTISVKVSDRMAPYWQPVLRNFFIYENIEMKQAATYAYTDNWREAALIWKLFTKDENKKLAAAACHNMALVCEVEGKLDIAEQWLEESLENYKSTLSQQYLKQIRFRLEETKKLDKQFGIE